VITTPYGWPHSIEAHSIEVLELNDVTNASSKALRLRGASPVPGFAVGDDLETAVGVCHDGLQRESSKPAGC
jgi:hypothetical protein